MAEKKAPPQTEEPAADLPEIPEPKEFLQTDLTNKKDSWQEGYDLDMGNASQ